MIIQLKPETDDELQQLNAITERNKYKIWKYQPTDVLDFEIPFSEEEFAIASQVKQVLAKGGRVLLLTPDSNIPQELVLNNED